MFPQSNKCTNHLSASKGWTVHWLSVLPCFPLNNHSRGRKCHAWCVGGFTVWTPNYLLGERKLKTVTSLLPPPTENLLAIDYGFPASTLPQFPRWLADFLVYQDYLAESCHHSESLHYCHSGCCFRKDNILFPLNWLVRVPVKQFAKCQPFFLGIKYCVEQKV